MKQGNLSALAICQGCGIGECISVEGLILAAGGSRESLPSVIHPCLCSDEGLEAIHTLCRESEVDRLAVAACSPRARTDLFRLKGIHVERVNLREQLTWVMEPGSEDTQMMADDLVRMAMARMDAIAEVKPYVPDQPVSEILVVGGGVAGMHAAYHGAEAGYTVHLVEKGEALGGYGGRIRKLLPSSGGQQLREPDVTVLAKRLEAHPRIRLHLGESLESLGGEPGHFKASFRQRRDGILEVGSVVVATGWKPYSAEKLAYLGYGSGQVLTLEEFEQQAADREIPDRVTFILCAGSRDPGHLAYCSAYCCSAALKQALYVRERNPGSTVYIIYRDIRTPGFQETFYQLVQSDDSILMTRGIVDSVSEGGEGLLVAVRESLLGEDITVASDLVVLATGMVPCATEDLGLRYRLGTGLPGLEYGFPDSHFICFPYETRRTGIYAAGTARAPMDFESAAEDGAGAMMKAIQCIECVKRGEAVHPRSGDRSHPLMYMERCTDCKRCTEECPFGMYDENEKGTPLPNPSRCRRCGICMGSCPERVIGFADFSIHSVSAMIKSIPMPDEFEEKPRVLVFLCENDAYPALDAAGFGRLSYSPFIRIIPVRCLGSVNKVWISDALSHGYDGILQIGCKPGDDYQCHFIQGSELTGKRSENLQETLETMMLEPERIRTEYVEITDLHRIVGIINDYVEELELIGPNPFKSM